MLFNFSTATETMEPHWELARGASGIGEANKLSESEVTIGHFKESRLFEPTYRFVGRTSL